MGNTIELEARNLSIGYIVKKKKKIIHSNLNISLYSGSVTSLLGLNGAGKSTLLRTLCGFQPSLGGEVLLKGRPLPSYSQHEFARNVGVVLTDRTNTGGITVAELVSLGRHPYTGFFGRLKEKDFDIVDRAMSMVGISDKRDNYVAELSDGERQKAMIAKALAQECPIIVLDEPTSFLDVTSRIEIMTLLHKLAETENKAILLSTHDIELAIQLSDSIWLLGKDGSGIKHGSPENLILSGKFNGFFDRDGIEFDAATGKFFSSYYIYEVNIEGEPLTMRWAINALARNHFGISSKPATYPMVNCVSPNEILLRFSNNETVICDGIDSLIDKLKCYFIHVKNV